MQEQIELSVIIVNYNSNNVLENCLHSINKSELGFRYEIVLIDNASPDSPEYILKKYPNVLLIKNEINVGFAAANNRGIKQATGKFILLLNPDTIVNENSFQPMIKYLNYKDDVGIVGCKIFNADGEIERSTHSFPTLLKEFVHANEFIKKILSYKSWIARFLRKFFKTKSLDSYWDHNRVKEVDHVTGACMMVKKEAIDKVGLLDEAFFLYNEEVEWSLRFKKAGYKSVFLPDSSIIHLFGYSTKQVVQRQKLNHLLVERYRGMFYFFQKHYGFLRLILLRVIVFQGFTLRLFSYLLKALFSKSNQKKEEIHYMIKIIGLCFHTNFDWRKS